MHARVERNFQAKPLVETAATALALLIAHHVVRLGQVDVTNYGERVKELMVEKSRLLSKAQAFADMGLEETARPIWSCAASY